MKIAIGSDNAGFGLKEFLKGKLMEAGYEVEDLGTLRRDAEIRYMDAADPGLPKRFRVALPRAEFCAAEPGWE